MFLLVLLTYDVFVLNLIFRAHAVHVASYEVAVQAAVPFQFEYGIVAADNLVCIAEHLQRVGMFREGPVCHYCYMSCHLIRIYMNQYL